MCIGVTCTPHPPQELLCSPALKFLRRAACLTFSFVRATSLVEIIFDEQAKPILTTALYNMEAQLSAESLFRALSSVRFLSSCHEGWRSPKSVWGEVAVALNMVNSDKSRKSLYMRWTRNWQGVQSQFNDAFLPPSKPRPQKLEPEHQ